MRMRRNVSETSDDRQDLRATGGEVGQITGPILVRRGADVMGPRVLAVLGVVVMAASGVWWFLDGREAPLPEGAVAGTSVTIQVGEGAGGWPLTWPQTGVAAGAVLLVAGLIWALAARRRATAVA